MEDINDIIYRDELLAWIISDLILSGEVIAKIVYRQDKTSKYLLIFLDDFCHHGAALVLISLADHPETI